MCSLQTVVGYDKTAVDRGKHLGHDLDTSQHIILVFYSTDERLTGTVVVMTSAVVAVAAAATFNDKQLQALEICSGWYDAT